MPDGTLWEQHSRWWQDEFTDGADPEYEEQILPLIDRHLAGARAGALRTGRLAALVHDRRVGEDLADVPAGMVVVKDRALPVRWGAA